MKWYKALGTAGRNFKYVHRMRAEAALGKPLPPGATVHHADGSMNADAPLVICQNNAYHRLLHARMRVKAAGGNPNTDAICGKCRRVKHRAEFSLAPALSTGRSNTCRPCHAAYQQQRLRRVGDRINARRRERYANRQKVA